MSSDIQTSIYLPPELRVELTEWNTNHPTNKVNISSVCREAIIQALAEKKGNEE